MPIATPEGYHYFVTFICTKTDYWATVCLRKKSDTFLAFKVFKAQAECEHPGLHIIEFQEDKGEEYMSAEFINFCAEHGIQHRHTEPDEPYQNGQAEHANRTISERANAILIESKLPATFWGHAVHFFVHVCNRCPIHALPDSTPYTEYDRHHWQPDIAHFRVFGCLAYVLVQKKK